MKIQQGMALLFFSLFTQLSWSQTARNGEKFRQENKAVEQCYSMQFRQRAKTSLGNIDRKLAGKDTTVLFSVKGEFCTLPLGHNTKWELTGARFLMPKVLFSVSGVENKPLEEAIAHDLQKPFLLYRTSNRQIHSFYTAAISPLSCQMLRTILGQMEFLLPVSPAEKGEEWKTEEENAEGKYQACYVVQSGSARRIAAEKRILSYSSLRKHVPLAGVKVLLPRLLPSGTAEAVFQKRGRALLSLQSLQCVKSTIEGVPGAVEWDSLQMRRIRTAPGASAQGSVLPARFLLLQKSSAHLLFRAPDYTRQQKALAKTELGRETFSSLMERMAEKEAEGASGAPSLVIPFRALLLLHPADIAPLQQILAQADPHSLTARTIANVLQATGTRRAQAALCDVLVERRQDTPLSAMLLQWAGMLAAPDKASLNTVRWFARNALHREVRQQALLAYGAMLNAYAYRRPHTAALLVSALSNEFPNESPTVFLEALGNAGTAGIVPIAAPFLHSPHVNLRVEALCSLRKVLSQRVRSMLADRLLHDPSAEVRAQCVQVIVLQKAVPLLQTSLRKALKTEKSPMVRQEIRAALKQTSLSSRNR